AEALDPRARPASCTRATDLVVRSETRGDRPSRRRRHRDVRRAATRRHVAMTSRWPDEEAGYAARRGIAARRQWPRAARAGCQLEDSPSRAATARTSSPGESVITKPRRNTEAAARRRPASL